MHIGPRSFDWSRPVLMGILNLTPDSFFDGGKYAGLDAALAQVQRMCDDGVEVVDIGGQSTRPGSSAISAEAELARVLPAIKEIAKQFPKLALSIDTDKAKVADAALTAGAHMVNDVTALRGDSQMSAVVVKHAVPVVLMHAQGNPKTMQEQPVYTDVVQDVYDFLQQRIDIAVTAGVSAGNIIVDPGIGFGKTLAHNLLLLKHLDVFKPLACPLLLGTSNKSFIGQILDAPVNEREAGTQASMVWGLTKGAAIFRVHNVKLARQSLQFTHAMMGAA